MDPNRRRTQWPAWRPEKQDVQHRSDSSSSSLPPHLVRPPLPPAKKPRNHGPQIVPTKKMLAHHLCIITKTVWDFYECIEHTTKQGRDVSSKAVISRRLQSGSESTDKCLYIIKQIEGKPEANPVMTLPKIEHKHLVTLHCAFREGGNISLVYEGMDLSLHQILGVDPKSLMYEMPIASICGQVCRLVNSLFLD